MQTRFHSAPWPARVASTKSTNCERIGVQLVIATTTLSLTSRWNLTFDRLSVRSCGVSFGVVIFSVSSRSGDSKDQYTHFYTEKKKQNKPLASRVWSNVMIVSRISCLISSIAWTSSVSGSSSLPGSLVGSPLVIRCLTTNSTSSLWTAASGCNGQTET